MAYLDDHKTKVPQQRKPRRQAPRIIVVHTTQQQPDLDGADTGAEALAEAILHSDRPASYHRVTDRDSVVRLVEDANEAFGARGGYNQIALHVSMATDAFKWDQLTVAQRRDFGLRCAEVVAEWSRAHNIVAAKITKDQVDAGARGVCGHGDLDPDRRSDPGWDADEWAGFLAVVIGILTGGAPVCEIEMPGSFWSGVGRWPKVRVYSDGRLVPINGAPRFQQLTDFGISKPNHPITDGWYDDHTGRIVIESEGDGGTFALARVA